MDGQVIKRLQKAGGYFSKKKKKKKNCFLKTINNANLSAFIRPNGFVLCVSSDKHVTAINLNFVLYHSYITCIFVICMSLVVPLE
jgi:hypothetical protein